jgi:preprotein translocase subunit SecD/preprotein translocase subunit SecF
MFMRPMFRFVPDNTRVHFMRARFFGLAGSFLLSALSIGLFFYPGLNLGIDFKGGIVMEVQTPHDADIAALRSAFAGAHIQLAGLQTFGGPRDLLVRLDTQPTEGGNQALQSRVRDVVEKTEPGAKVLRADVVGAAVSGEMFANGMLALGISLAMIMAYIWFRFEWQFAIGAVVTLLLDVTKTVGFLVVTGIQFDLVMVAAILTIIGYSTNDKVVVYDRVRENLRKYKSMPLRDLIDLSINETLNRTLGTSCTVFLASLPLAIWGGETLSGFAWTMLFGIAIGTVSSIMIAAPILLLLGEHRLRRDVASLPAKPGAPAAARP